MNLLWTLKKTTCQVATKSWRCVVRLFQKFGHYGTKDVVNWYWCSTLRLNRIRQGDSLFDNTVFLHHLSFFLLSISSNFCFVFDRLSKSKAHSFQKERFVLDINLKSFILAWDAKSTFTLAYFVSTCAVEYHSSVHHWNVLKTRKISCFFVSRHETHCKQKTHVLFYVT